MNSQQGPPQPSLFGNKAAGAAPSQPTGLFGALSKPAPVPSAAQDSSDGQNSSLLRQLLAADGSAAKDTNQKFSMGGFSFTGMQLIPILLVGDRFTYSEAWWM